MASSIPASRTDRPASPWGEAWRRFRRHRMATLSLGVLALLVVAVVLGPFAWRMPIDAIDFSATTQGPSLAHPFGTDDLGQDLLARMLYGGRISLAVGICSATSVTTGINALRSTWRVTTRCSGRPLERAVVTWSRRTTSSTAERT